MANNGRIFQDIFRWLFLCFAIDLIVQLHVSARQLSASKDDTLKIKSNIFEPISMEFPNIIRTGAEAEKYKDDLLNTMSKRARKENKNLKLTGESCARGLGHLYKVITDEDKILYEICYDDDRSSAIYTTHIVDLANKTLERSSHLSFKATYTLNSEKINEKYTAAQQTEKFIEILGKPITSENTREGNYFSRNHLTPHADFPLASEQKLTYFFQNCVPGKQSMNQGNWSTLEALVRAISIQMNKVLRVFTGVYGILSKKNKKGQLVDLYLDFSDNDDKKSVEIPAVVWKLVIDEKTNDSVAFFTSNDTEMDEDQVAHFSTLCHSVCSELGYNFKSTPKSGITLCCPYNEFVKHIQYLPINLKKTKLLKNTVHLEKWAGKSPKGKKSDDSPAKAA